MRAAGGEAVLKSSVPDELKAGDGQIPVSGQALLLLPLATPTMAFPCQLCYEHHAATEEDLADHLWKNHSVQIKHYSRSYDNVLSLQLMHECRICAAKVQNRLEEIRKHQREKHRLELEEYATKVFGTSGESSSSSNNNDNNSKAQENSSSSSRIESADRFSAGFQSAFKEVSIKGSSSSNDDDDVSSVPTCRCIDGGGGEREGPVYKNLGVAATWEDLHHLMCQRFKCDREQVLLVEAVFCAREGKTDEGCPKVEDLVRRQAREAYTVVFKTRSGHSCSASCVVIALVAWEGMEEAAVSRIYERMVPLLSAHGLGIVRGCRGNKNKTCRCQGDEEQVHTKHFI